MVTCSGEHQEWVPLFRVGTGAELMWQVPVLVPKVWNQLGTVPVPVPIPVPDLNLKPLPSGYLLISLIIRYFHI